MRVVDPVTPGLGGPQVSGGGMARKDRHTFLVGRQASGSLSFEDARKSIAEMKSRAGDSIRTAGSEVRPVFFLNPLG